MLTLISIVSFIYTLIHDVNNDQNAIILFNVFLNISIILIIIAVIYPFRKKNNFDIQKKTTKQNIKRHNFNYKKQNDTESIYLSYIAFLAKLAH